MVFNKRGSHGCLDFNNTGIESFQKKKKEFNILFVFIPLFLMTKKEGQKHRDFSHQESRGCILEIGKVCLGLSVLL